MNYFLNRYKKWGHEINPKEITLKKSIRLNTHKISEKQIVLRLKKNGIFLKKISFLKTGYYYDSEFSPGSTPEYLFGYYYMQEAASQAVVEVLNPQENEIILDMCAAPGSKTTHISQLMKNTGILVALDKNLNRIASLNNNLERMGCSNVVVYKKDAKYADDLEKQFDRILLDAPCSGNFVIDKEWFIKRETSDLNEITKEQKKLIGTAIAILKEGGTLVYSTCSLEKEENEDIVEYALKTFDVKLEKIDLMTGENGLTEETKLCKRFWPEKTGTQGFFIAKFKKIS